MKRRSGPPPIYLASSDAQSTVRSEQRLQSMLSTLEECRAILLDKASPETARLLSLAILELRMELNNVTDTELKALCDLVVTEHSAQDDKADQRSPSYLKLVR